MPALSADGKWLAYVSRQNGNYDIWARPTAGGLPSLLTTNTSDDYSPSWSPDGKALVFVSRRDDAEGDLYLLHLKTREGGFAPGQIKRLTDNLQREAFPQFSPDGKNIAYCFGAKGQEQVWLYEIKTGKRYQLSTRGGTQPAWSPSGNELAVACRTVESEEHQIFIISADTSQADYLRRQVTFEGDNGYPSWSRDGKNILVQRYESSANAAARRSRLYIMPVDFASGTLEQLSTGLQITPDSEGALFPYWGVDGAIYYVADHYGNLDVWRMPETGPIPRFNSPQAAFENAQAIVDHEAALLAYSALRYHFPDSSRWLAMAGVEMGRRYLQLGDAAQARKSFNNVVLYYRADNYEGAGLAELELAKLDGNVERLATLRDHYRAWPNVQAWCSLESGIALQKQGRAEQALQIFQNLPSQFPHVREVCYQASLRAADLLLARERNDAAEARYVETIAQYREQEDWRAASINRLLNVAPVLARTSDTLAAYQRLIQKHNSISEITHAARFRIAERLQRDGETALAENEWHSLINSPTKQNDPLLQNLRGEAMLRLMRLHLAQNDFPAAELLYPQMQKEYSGPPEFSALQTARRELTQASLHRGRMLMRGQDYELARAVFLAARRYDAREVEAHRGYLETMNALGQIDEAIDEYTNLTNANPRDEIALYALGLAYSYKGEGDAKTLRRSAALIEAALARNYRLVPAYLTLGFNYEGIEKLEQKERERKKKFFEKVAFALPGFLDNLRRTLTFRPPRQPERWYEKAIETLTTAIALNDENTEPQREALLALNLANNYYNFGEFGYENAHRYYQIKIRYDSTFATPQQRAIICERIGQTGWVSGKYQEAAPYLREAVTRYRLLRDVEGELRNLQRLALLYQTSGDYNTSNEYFREFINASRRENRESNVALVWRNIAYNHQQLAENDDAITRGERSLGMIAEQGSGAYPQPQKSKLMIKLLGLPIFWKTLEPTGEESTGESLTFEQEREFVFSIIEESHALRKDFEEAVAALEAKLQSFRHRKERKGEALALNNLGNLHYNLRDYAQAEEHFKRSFQICAKNNFAGGAIVNLINLGNLALLRARSEDADVSYLTAKIDSLLQLSREALAQVAAQTPRQKLAVLNLLGNLAYYNAEHSWPESAAPSGLAQNHADQNERASLSQELRRSWLALHYWGEARAAYDTALTLARAHRLPREEIIVRRNLASLLTLAQDFPAAFANLRFAHDLCIEHNYTELTWRIENALGALTHFAPEQSYSEKSALDWYRNAITLLEGLPEEPEGIEQRLSESEEQNALYENAVTVLAKMGEKEKSFQLEALQLAERKQARHFMNLIATRYILPKEQQHRLIWGGGGGEVSYLRRVLSRLRGELIKLQAEEPQRPKELGRARAQLQQTERDYQEIIRIALEEDPELASFFSVQSVDAQALRDSLATGTAILKYFVAENEILIWLIAQDRIEQVCVPYSRARLRQDIARLREAWTKQSPESATRAQALSMQLLAPWKNLEDYSRLILAPDDALHYLPFAALPYHGEALAQQFTLVYVSSLQALQFAARHKNLNAENLLIVQDAEASTPEFAKRLATLKVQTLQGVDWRGETALHPQVQAAGLLHLQSRFVIQPERPLDSGFALRFTSNNRVETARLPLYRLFETELRASVLVLENTSFPYQRPQTGEEIVALQRSLFYAGVPSLILCQWEAAPAVRNTFYAQFYANLANHSLAAAFSAAQLATRERHPDSYDWAAFELIGYQGMSETEKNAFAQKYFLENVAKGNRAQELNEFGDAISYYRAALTMAKQLDQQEAIQRLRLLIKASAISGADFAAACEIEEALLADAQAAKDLRRITQSYRNLSTWRLRLQDYRAAEEAERQYFALAERANNAPAMGGSLLQLAQIHQAANDYDRALAAAEKAAEIFAAQHQPFARFQAEIFLGKLALENDRYHAALDYLEPALANFQTARSGASALPPQEQRALATAKQLLGAASSRLTAYQQALKLHHEAREIFSALADTANLTRAEQFVAETYWLKADYQQALLHQQRALKLAAPLRDEPLQIRGQTALGLILLSLGDFEAGLDAQKQALQIALEWEEERENEARREQATVHKNLGLTYIQRGQTEQALASFKQAAGLDAQLAAERGLLYDYLNLGQVWQTLNQPDSAQSYLVKAETLAARLQDQRGLAKIFYTKGLLAWNRSNKAVAQAAFSEALRRSEQTHLDELQWRCLWKLGALAKQESSLEPARDYYQRALAALERLSAKIKIEEYRSGFIDDKSELYEEAVLLLLQMKREAEAFAIAERAKSRSFADLLGNSGVDWQAGADRALLDRRERLLEQINFTQGKISTLQAQPSEAESARLTVAALTDSLATLQKAYTDLLVEIKSANPELADAVSVEPLPLAEVQAMLADSVALIEYFFAKDRLVSWVVDQAQARAVSTPLDRKRLGESVAQFRRAIQKRASTEAFSRELYDAFIKPIAPLLANATQLVIVPHGALHYVPFPALQRADSTYLIDHYALALAPSATALGFCYRKGAALPEQGEKNYRVLALGNPEVGNSRLDLPFAEKEIKSLEQTFGEIQSFTRREATHNALLAAKDNAELLHFSCHGVYDEKNPLFSALLLAPESASDDGRLAAHEIFGLKLNTHLVMLSACETGLARVTGGDEVVGLARSFIFAGTPSLIASLWTVDDLATAITVKRFYRYLKAGDTKAQALRAAQRFVRDHHNRHPAYWASFGLTGDWR